MSQTPDGILAKNDEAMSGALAGLTQHLDEIESAGRAVRGIQAQVATAYQAGSGASHCAAIDDWLRIHARVTKVTENFRHGTHQVNYSIDEGELDAGGYVNNLVFALGGK
ncbi:hypothetical protein [Streptomyces sp. NBC_00648]|uniref:hypothetical protein n=1 Tax=Streptomyces sp. NBC_00648 TaxID=2975797 RepID=UPI00324DB675